MQRLRTINHLLVLALIFVITFTSCQHKNKSLADKTNEISYFYHYRNLDSAVVYARKVLNMRNAGKSSRAEAWNNIVFTSIAKMQYELAERQLDSAMQASDNQIELLVADVQMMRLCQKRSRNKDFYAYRESALHRLARISEESANITAHEKRRLSYAKSEFAIVSSTYFYYVGLEKQSVESFKMVDETSDLLQDTAQLLNYYYNIGAGGIIVGKSAEETAQTEFDYLMHCFLLAKEKGLVYFEANAMEAMSEHLNDRNQREFLINNNLPAMKFINIDMVEDSLLAGNLALRSLELFTKYGDVYQIAGAYRTLAECYWQINDYTSALDCLNKALNTNININKAPDLVASIREQLSLTYSALNNKPLSDYNRNLYLDVQEKTRQDRQLEARASSLSQATNLLNLMLIVVALMIVLSAIVLILMYRAKKHSKADNKGNEYNQAEEELSEKQQVSRLRLKEYKKKEIEQRARLSLINGITPLIDRLLNEEQKLITLQEDDSTKAERLEYVRELVSEINNQNQSLTKWIQMQQGQLNLHIESFPVQDLFNIIQKSATSFSLKGITLSVKPTSNVVKADKTLTLFMINTIADNARKATKEGGTVAVSSKEYDNYVEISVEDNGKGISQTELEDIFNHKFSAMKKHGFGLANCKGIIERYKKISKVFNVCHIGAESIEDKGSRFFFRLPKGLAKLILAMLMFVPTNMLATNGKSMLDSAKIYADSAYFCNIDEKYYQTLKWVEKSFAQLNAYYKAYNKQSSAQLSLISSEEAPEISWFMNGAKMNYDIVLDVRNECAVAALALHRWDVYHYNNQAYNKLFHLKGADRKLSLYVRLMQKQKSNKNIAIGIMIFLLLIILYGCYLLLRSTLKRNIALDDTKQNELEYAEDELHRIDNEAARLHVGNSVLDNCLSTLKHETMYYPSRIAQLLSEDERDMNAIYELTAYYKKLHEILSAQAMKQTEGKYGVDGETIRYLIDIISKIDDNNNLQIIAHDSKDGRSVDLEIPLKKQYSDEEVIQMFTSNTSDFRFLICRQIIREAGEERRSRGNGIKAVNNDNGQTIIRITINKEIWINSKL